MGVTHATPAQTQMAKLFNNLSEYKRDLTYWVGMEQRAAQRGRGGGGGGEECAFMCRQNKKRKTS